MDIATIGGLILGVAAVTVGFVLEGGHLSSVFQFPALMIVIGGTIGASMVTTSFATLKKIPEYMRIALFGRTPESMETIDRIVKMAERARREGVLGLEKDVEAIEDPFFKKAVRQAQNLGRWFSQDVMMSENITVGDHTGTSDVELLTCYWQDWANGDTFNVRYLCFDDADSLKHINRTLITRDIDSIVTANITTPVAFGLYSANSSQQDDTWFLSVEAR